MSNDSVFRVGLTRDVRRSDGGISLGDIGFGVLERTPGIEWDFLARVSNELTPDLVKPFDAIVVWKQAVTRATLQEADRLALVVRLGVGYDAVDVEALTQSGIPLAITPDGVRRPMASAALTFILALGHRLLIKDRLTRNGTWDAAYDEVGVGLTGRTLGIVGMGNIGRELLRLIKPFDMRCLVADPYARTEDAAACGAELVGLDALLAESDFVCIICPLTPETRHLIGGEQLDRMRKTAYLINIARGPIVDEAALVSALQEGIIAGAALDVFEQEPLPEGAPILSLPNVILAPHAIGGTDELYLELGRSACRAVLDVAQGRLPSYVVNQAALQHPSFRAKRALYAERNGGIS